MPRRSADKRWPPTRNGHWRALPRAAGAFAAAVVALAAPGAAEEEPGSFRSVGPRSRFYQATGYRGSRVLEHNVSGRFAKYVEVTWTQASTVDQQGRIWTADRMYHQVIFQEPRTRFLPWAAYYTGYAGQRGIAGYGDGSRQMAKFDSPMGIAVATMSGTATIYVADTNNHCIRSIAISNGQIVTIAGFGGRPGLSDGRGVESRFRYPMSLGIDAEATSLFVLDNERRIRFVDLRENPAFVHTLVSGACRGVSQYNLFTSIVFRTVGCHPDWRAVEAGDPDVAAIQKILMCKGHVTTCGPRHHPALADRLSKRLLAVPQELAKFTQP